MRNRYLIVSILIAAVGLIAFPSSLFACSCGTVRPTEAFADASNIFIGTPVAARRLTSGGFIFDGPQNIYQFKVYWSLKGSAEIPEVSTNESTASCGYPFRLGRYYLVYAKSNGKFVSTALCNRTNWLFLAGPDLLWASSGIEIDDDKFYTVAIIGPVAAGLLFLGLLVWRRRRARPISAAQPAAGADR